MTRVTPPCATHVGVKPRRPGAGAVKVCDETRNLCAHRGPPVRVRIRFRISIGRGSTNMSTIHSARRAPDRSDTVLRASSARSTVRAHGGRGALSQSGSVNRRYDVGSGPAATHRAPAPALAVERSTRAPAPVLLGDRPGAAAESSESEPHVDCARLPLNSTSMDFPRTQSVGARWPVAVHIAPPRRAAPRRAAPRALHV